MAGETAVLQPPPDAVYLDCCCCGGGAGKWKQHWNRDDGYGICVRCVDYLKGRGMSDEDILSNYGKRGVNWGP